MDYHIRILALAALASLLLAGCASHQAQPAQGGRMKAVATFYPMYDVLKSVGGDKVEASSLVPNGVEPHDYDPTPKQIVDLGDAGVVVELGIGFDSLEGKLANGIGKGAVVVNASRGVSLAEGGQEDPTAAGVDPHVWVSPRRMIIITENVRKGLDEADPSGSTYYDANAAAYEAKLRELDSEFTAGLSNCSKPVILTSHNAFGYLASDYGFRQLYVSGLTPEAEPTPQQIANLVDTARDDNITVVFYEELVDPRVSQTIAEEVGARTMELSPLEGTKNQSEDYFSIMRRNLDSLRTAMECG
jgi:zinc transport system substrate-binding protein